VAGSDLGGVKTRPIRAVEAGPLFFECWVEEGKAKEVLAKLAERDVGGSQGSTQPF
jgi:mitotic spindle assembly checkpoint protein MAD2B